MSELRNPHPVPLPQAGEGTQLERSGATSPRPLAGEGGTHAAAWEGEGEGAKRLRALGYGLALAVFILDQLTKYWIIEVVRLREHGFVELLPVLNLTWVENRGVSMGMLTADGDAGRWALVGLTALISAVVAVWLWRERSRLDVLALGLVLGGAIGNIVDRARYGYVVDFVHVFWGQWSFYVFNVADAAITVGVILLLLRALFARKPEQPSLESDR